MSEIIDYILRFLLGEDVSPEIVSPFSIILASSEEFVGESSLIKINQIGSSWPEQL